MNHSCLAICSMQESLCFALYPLSMCAFEPAVHSISNSDKSNHPYTVMHAHFQLTFIVLCYIKVGVAITWCSRALLSGSNTLDQVYNSRSNALAKLLCITNGPTQQPVNIKQYFWILSSQSA